MIHSSPEQCLANIEAAVGKILERAQCRSYSAATTPCRSRSCGRSAPRVRPICVVQIDAHLDFVDERFGVREGHGNVMRRIAEMEHVTRWRRSGSAARAPATPATSRTRGATEA